MKVFTLYSFQNLLAVLISSAFVQQRQDSNVERILAFLSHFEDVLKSIGLGVKKYIKYFNRRVLVERIKKVQKLPKIGIEDVDGRVESPESQTRFVLDVILGKSGQKERDKKENFFHDFFDYYLKKIK